jgi:hypothetical protein
MISPADRPASGVSSADRPASGALVKAWERSSPTSPTCPTFPGSSTANLFSAAFYAAGSFMTSR